MVHKYNGYTLEEEETMNIEDILPDEELREVNALVIEENGDYNVVSFLSKDFRNFISLNHRDNDRVLRCSRIIVEHNKTYRLISSTADPESKINKVALKVLFNDDAFASVFGRVTVVNFEKECRMIHPLDEKILEKIIEDIEKAKKEIEEERNGSKKN